MELTNETEAIRELRVTGRRQLAESTIEIELDSLDGTPLPAWSPGAHVDLRLGQDMIRQYSLVRPVEGSTAWRVAVLVETGGRGGSLLIHRTLQVGASVKVSGPRNHFPLSAEGPYLFIAGGIGITPLLAMCEQAEAAGADWTLAYLGRSRDNMSYLDALTDRWGDRVMLFIGAEGRHCDVAALIAAQTEGTQVYCCGPERLMSEVEAVMADRDPDLVHLERFRPRDVSPDENEEFTVYARKSGVEFVVPADESILMSADFEGIVVPGDCLEGTCGSCETRVLLGQIEHRDSVLSPQARRESVTMMICVSRAQHGCDRLELDL